MMRSTKRLKKLRQKTTQRLIKLRLLANKATELNWAECDRLIAYVTIESLNLWVNFARAYFLSCTLSPWREKGGKISLSNSNIRTFDDAIAVAMQKCKPYVWKKGKWGRSEEPRWREPTILLKCCSAIGCSNYADIESAFSVNTKVFEHLPTFRNFYAHRNDHTVNLAKKIARQYSIPVHNHPTQILCDAAYGRPQILILDWLDDLTVVVELLCE